MAVTMRQTLNNIASYLAASGYFDSTSISEPTDPPAGVHGAVMLAAYSHTSTTLNGTIERREVRVRVYINALREPREDVEFDLDEITVKVQEDLLGDYDLGGTVRNIEPLGMTTSFGYQTIGETKYRIADILVPMTVDDSATFGA